MGQSVVQLKCKVPMAAIGREWLEVPSGLSPLSHQVISDLLLQLEVGAGTKEIMLEMRSDETLGSTGGGGAGIPSVSEVE